MSELKTSTEKILVHLVRAGNGAEDYNLSAGATLADLLYVSQTSTAHHTVFINGVPPDEAVPLHEGAVITIVPRPTDAAGGEPWRATIPAFQDEALYQEYSDALNARRREVNSDEESQAG